MRADIDLARCGEVGSRFGESRGKTGCRTVPFRFQSGSAPHSHPGDVGTGARGQSQAALDIENDRTKERPIETKTTDRTTDERTRHDR